MLRSIKWIPLFAFILGTPWQPILAQVRSGASAAQLDEVPPEWTQLSEAQGDYVPRDFRVIQFPEESVGVLYLASQNQQTGVWERKRDGYEFWIHESLGDCQLANAQGRVTIPDSHPVILQLSGVRDLSFLDHIPPDAFVAIDARDTHGSLENLRRLMSRQAEQIRFPDRIDLTDAELSTLPAPCHLKYVPAWYPRELDRVLSRSSSVVQMQAGIPIAQAWADHESLAHLHIDMSRGDGDRGVFPVEHESLAVVASMPNLKELSVHFWAGSIDEERVAPLTKLTKPDAIDIKLPSYSDLAPVLDRNGALALSRIKNLRHVDFFQIAEEAYPIFEDLPFSSMSMPHPVSSHELFSRLAANRNLKHLPNIALPPEALRPLTERQDLLSIDLTSQGHLTPQSSHPVYEEIVRANPNLRSLRLHKIAVNQGLAAAILSCSELESLELDDVVFLENVNFNGTLSALKTLAILELRGGGNTFQEAFQLNCPEVVTVEIRGRWLWQDIALLQDCSKVERLKLQTNGPFDGRFVKCLNGMPVLADLETGLNHWDYLSLTAADVVEVAKLKRLVRLRIAGNLTAEDLLPLRANGMLHYLKVQSPVLSDKDWDYLPGVFLPCRISAAPSNPN